MSVAFPIAQLFSCVELTTRPSLASVLSTAKYRSLPDNLPNVQNISRIQQAEHAVEVFTARDIMIMCF